MNTVVVIIVAIAGVGIGLAAGYFLPPHGFRPSRNRPRPVSRILLPFTGQEISKRAFEAAVRVARAENATIMPAFLARVPRTLPLDAPLPKACTFGMPLLEAIVVLRIVIVPLSQKMPPPKAAPLPFNVLS